MSDNNTTGPRWVWHEPGFASLMIGRVQLAQVSHGATTWAWTLFFCEKGERSTYADEDKAVAMQAAEDHARKVLAA